MRDANETYLNDHMAAVDESERTADWKEDYVKALLAEGGELYPFKPDNFIEALRESGDGLLTASAAFFGTAEKLKSDTSIQCAYLSIRLAVKDYWEAVANKIEKRMGIMENSDNSENLSGAFDEEKCLENRLEEFFKEFVASHKKDFN